MFTVLRTKMRFIYLQSFELFRNTELIMSALLYCLNLNIYWKQVCIPVGCVTPACCPYLPACTAPWGCLLPGDVCSQGVSALGVVDLGRAVHCPGGSALGGVCWGGYCVSQHALKQTPPVNRMTDRQV